jgi:hypothetical protein
MHTTTIGVIPSAHGERRGGGYGELLTPVLSEVVRRSPILSAIPSISSTDKSVCATTILPYLIDADAGKSWCGTDRHRHSCLCFGKMQRLALLTRSPVRGRETQADLFRIPSISSTDKSVCATTILPYLIDDDAGKSWCGTDTAAPGRAAAACGVVQGRAGSTG